MSSEDPIKSADLKLKELEIELKRKELEQRAKFDFGRAAVAVTVIGGLAAVLFQGLAAWGSRTDKQRAEIEQQSAETRARSDFDSKDSNCS